MAAEISSLYSDAPARADVLPGDSANKSHRGLLVALWLFAGAWFIAFSLFAANGIRYARGFEVNGSQVRDVFPGAPLVSEAEIKSYYAGSMPELEMSRFEVSVRDGLVIVPKGHTIVVSGQFEGVDRTVIMIVVCALSLYGGMSLLQYLVLGFGSPVRLFRRRR